MKVGLIVKEAILQCIEKGMIEKHEIYTKVSEELGLPRPTVRRCARDLKQELINKVKVLDGMVWKSGCEKFA